MNFDLGVSYSYIIGTFLTTTLAVAGINTNLPSQLQLDPMSGPITVVAANNLLATEIVTDTSQGSLSVVDVITAQGQFDAVYSMCQTVAPVGGADYLDANILTPSSAAVNYFHSRSISIGASNIPKISLITAPMHGELHSEGYAYGAYRYDPNKDYWGVDSMTFTIEVKGRNFKVIYSVDVVPAPGSGSPICPNGLEIREISNPADGRIKRGSVDIGKLPKASQYDIETIALCHRMVSFALGTSFTDDGGALNFTELTGGALCQTTGTSITLDTNAASATTGSSTPPPTTANSSPPPYPNEWVAKQGSAAYGKMDMLSLLLHENGHALGIEHSADAHSAENLRQPDWIQSGIHG